VSTQPFEDVVAEHGSVVLRVCRALLAPADADDAWSETFLAALRAYPRLAEGSNVRAWLVTIAHRKAIDQLRASTRRARTNDALRAVPPTVVPEPSVDDDGVRAAVAALPTKQRLAVVHRYLADVSYADIAIALGCSEAAARRSASDGIAALRRATRCPEGDAP
jgi:RNA polymerase sigma factor (sigma-70 family)